MRVSLHGRRVPGWIVAVSDTAPSGLDPGRIIPILSHSGRSVAPDVVDLSAWIARRWFGPRRAVLAAAAAPRVRSAEVHPRRGQVTVPDDPVADQVVSVAGSGGGLLRIPPLVSVLPGVLALAARGPVLVVCPTVRMAALGAAWLRRRGARTALLPEEWDAARAGVDVVIGARSAVLAPCEGLTAIVVIDAHDESLKQERTPAWDATTVAIERGRRLGVPVVATSPVPPASDRPAHPVRSPSAWPRIVVEDLGALPVWGSMLGTAMLGAVRSPGAGTLCILNTKGGARLLACRSCRSVQRCVLCRSALSADGEAMTCRRCGEDRGSVCVECGGATLRTLRQGTTGLLAELRRSTGVTGVEVTAESVADSLVGGVFVGTEALLNRVAHADTVVFCDIDRDLGAPRITAAREVLALVAKAARIVGPGGSVVLQTRDPDHPAMRALAAADVDAAVADFLDHDVAARRQLGLPPFARVLRITGVGGVDPQNLLVPEGVDVRVDDDGIEVRTVDDESAEATVTLVSRLSTSPISVHADPARF